MQSFPDVEYKCNMNGRPFDFFFFEILMILGL